ncbi:MAG: ABC transporter ATP-binding protein/permease [Campylobacterales bacterium]|nr:ABC transporter ATP-binding protein/permease [Campylobacterales bacterium]
MNRKFSSIRKIFNISLQIAGQRSSLLKRSVFFYLISFIGQGIGYVLLLPFLTAILKEEPNINDGFFWLIMIWISLMVYLIGKWFAHDLDHTGDIVDMSHDLRLKLGDKLKTMPLEKLFRYRTGELSSTFSTGVEYSVLHMGALTGLIIEAFVTPFVLLVAIFFVDYKIGLFLLCMIPFGYILYFWKRGGSFQEKQEFFNSSRELESDIIEYIQGIVVLKSLNKTGENGEKLKRSVRNMREVQGKNLGLSVLPMTVMNSFIDYILIGVLFLGGYLIDNSTFQVATLLWLVIIYTRVMEPLTLFLALTSVLDLVETSYGKIKELLNIKDLDIVESHQKIENFNIKFENVDFSYLDRENKVIKNFTHTIKENCFTAIVGSSGSGKTTITKLLMRYGDPQQGDIFLGGVNLKSFKSQDLLKFVTVVFQDVYLFDDTIYNNIKFGNPQGTKEDIIQAAKKAYCHDFIIQLPQGYETKVGEIGGGLSGGERQRISIARAILKDSPIVVLDEPTSALDTKSQVAVQKAINSLIKNKTLIVIAHKLSTIVQADEIIVLDSGEVVESGNHQQLINRKGRYYEMFQSQEQVKSWSLINE